MRPVIKSRNKAIIDAAQRQHYWALTPYERLALALRLNEQARRLYAANPANPPRPEYGRRVFKAATPIPRSGR